MSGAALVAQRIVRWCDQSSAGTLSGGRFLDMREFHRLTEGMSGPERAAVFAALPEDLQRSAWELEAERAREERRDPLDDPPPRRERVRKRTAGPVSFDRHAPDPLLTIAPRDYIEKLAGVEVPASGHMRCVLPGHESERTPSLKVYETPERGWYCFGCGRGGSIFDFGAALWGMSTRGREFRELRARLLRELGIDTSEVNTYGGILQGGGRVRGVPGVRGSRAVRVLGGV